MKASVINVYVPSRDIDILHDIEQLAKQQRISRSSAILEAIQEYVQAHGFPPSPEVKLHKIGSGRGRTPAAEQQPIDDELKQMLGL